MPLSVSKYRAGRAMRLHNELMPAGSAPKRPICGQRDQRRSGAGSLGDKGGVNGHFLLQLNSGSESRSGRGAFRVV